MLVRLIVTVPVFGVWLVVTLCMKKNVVAWGLCVTMPVPATLCVGEWSEGTWYGLLALGWEMVTGCVM